MKTITAIIVQWERVTRPRSPQQVAEQAYRTWSYVGRHRYIEPELNPGPEPVWRTLKLGWQAYVQPIPITEVFT